MADCPGAGAVSVSGNRPSCSCGCQPNYGGATCATRNCHKDYDCNSRGTSISGTYPTCFCSCSGGYTGSACETAPTLTTTTSSTTFTVTPAPTTTPWSTTTGAPATTTAEPTTMTTSTTPTTVEPTTTTTTTATTSPPSTASTSTQLTTTPTTTPTTAAAATTTPPPPAVINRTSRTREAISTTHTPAKRMSDSRTILSTETHTHDTQRSPSVTVTKVLPCVVALRGDGRGLGCPLQILRSVADARRLGLVEVEGRGGAMTTNQPPLIGHNNNSSNNISNPTTVVFPPPSTTMPTMPLLSSYASALAWLLSSSSTTGAAEDTENEGATQAPPPTPTTTTTLFADNNNISISSRMINIINNNSLTCAALLSVAVPYAVWGPSRVVSVALISHSPHVMVGIRGSTTTSSSSSSGGSHPSAMVVDSEDEDAAPGADSMNDDDGGATSAASSSAWTVTAIRVIIVNNNNSSSTSNNNNSSSPSTTHHRGDDGVAILTLGHTGRRTLGGSSATVSLQHIASCADGAVVAPVRLTFRFAAAPPALPVVVDRVVDVVTGVTAVGATVANPWGIVVAGTVLSVIAMGRCELPDPFDDADVMLNPLGISAGPDEWATVRGALVGLPIVMVIAKALAAIVAGAICVLQSSTSSSSSSSSSSPSASSGHHPHLPRSLKVFIDAVQRHLATGMAVAAGFAGGVCAQCGSFLVGQPAPANTIGDMVLGAAALVGAAAALGHVSWALYRCPLVERPNYRQRQHKSRRAKESPLIKNTHDADVQDRDDDYQDYSRGVDNSSDLEMTLRSNQSFPSLTGLQIGGGPLSLSSTTTTTITTTTNASFSPLANYSFSAALFSSLSSSSSSSSSVFIRVWRWLLRPVTQWELPVPSQPSGTPSSCSTAEPATSTTTNPLSLSFSLLSLSFSSSSPAPPSAAPHPPAPPRNNRGTNEEDETTNENDERRQQTDAELWEARYRDYLGDARRWGWFLPLQMALDALLGILEGIPLDTTDACTARLAVVVAALVLAALATTILRPLAVRLELGSAVATQWLLVAAASVHLANVGAADPHVEVTAAALGAAALVVNMLPAIIALVRGVMDLSTQWRTARAAAAAHNKQQKRDSEDDDDADDTHPSLERRAFPHLMLSSSLSSRLEGAVLSPTPSSALSARSSAPSVERLLLNGSIAAVDAATAPPSLTSSFATDPRKTSGGGHRKFGGGDGCGQMPEAGPPMGRGDDDEDANHDDDDDDDSRFLRQVLDDDHGEAAADGPPTVSPPQGVVAVVNNARRAATTTTPTERDPHRMRPQGGQKQRPPKRYTNNPVPPPAEQQDHGGGGVGGDVNVVDDGDGNNDGDTSDIVEGIDAILGSRGGGGGAPKVPLALSKVQTRDPSNKMVGSITNANTKTKPRSSYRPRGRSLFVVNAIVADLDEYVRTRDENATATTTQNQGDVDTSITITTTTTQNQGDVDNT